MTPHLSTAGRERESSAGIINGMKKKKMLQRYTTTAHSVPSLFRMFFIFIRLFFSLGKTFLFTDYFFLVQ